jgi:hypothetical protein
LRILSKLPGGQLIGGDSRADANAFGLLGVHSGEPCGAFARMIASAIAQRPAIDLSQPREHRQILAEWL